MSWAADNPEAYEALERSAAVRWLRGEEKVFYGEDESESRAPYTELVDMLQAEHPEIFRAIMDAGADQEIDYSEHEAFVPIMPKDAAMGMAFARAGRVLNQEEEFDALLGEALPGMGRLPDEHPDERGA